MSILENHRDSWKHRADEFSKQITQLHLDKQNMKQLYIKESNSMHDEMNKERDRMQVYKDAMQAIEKIATCSLCKDLMSDKKACMLSHCGHYICESCHTDLYQTIGPYEDAVCPEYRSVCAKTDNWTELFYMSDLVQLVKKTKQAE